MPNLQKKTGLKSISFKTKSKIFSKYLSSYLKEKLVKKFSKSYVAAVFMLLEFMIVNIKTVRDNPI